MSISIIDCPYCDGLFFEDKLNLCSLELKDGDKAEYECPNCHKEFIVYAQLGLKYSTYAKDELLNKE